MSLKGQVALITGAGSGIGKGAALRLASEGACIGALGRTKSQLMEVVDQIKGAGGSAIPLVADVSNLSQLQEAFATLGDSCGRIDIVVANAGVNGLWAPIEEITSEDWDYTMNINLKGTFMTVKYAQPWLKKQGGAIVVVSSVNGTRMFSNTGAVVYACSKGGQLIMTKMLAPELARDGVRINVICPGSITTEIGDNTTLRNQELMWRAEWKGGNIPLTVDVPGTIQQCGDLIHFLVSKESAHITGTEMWIDGGQSLVTG